MAAMTSQVIATPRRGAEHDATINRKGEKPCEPF